MLSMPRSYSLRYKYFGHICYRCLSRQGLSLEHYYTVRFIKDI